MVLSNKARREHVHGFIWILAMFGPHTFIYLKENAKNGPERSHTGMTFMAGK